MVIWLLGNVPKIWCHYSISRSYMLFQTQISIFAFLKSILCEIGTLKTIIKLLDVLCFLDKFLSSDLTEECSLFSWNLFTPDGFAIAWKQTSSGTNCNKFNSQIHLRILDTPTIPTEVLQSYHLMSAELILPNSHCPPVKICPKWNGKKDYVLCLEGKWTVLVAATIMCQKLLCGILKGACFWPLFPVKSVSD